MAVVIQQMMITRLNTFPRSSATLFNSGKRSHAGQNNYRPLVYLSSRFTSILLWKQITVHWLRLKASRNNKLARMEIYFS